MEQKNKSSLAELQSKKIKLNTALNRTEFIQALREQKMSAHDPKESVYWTIQAVKLARLRQNSETFSQERVKIDSQIRAKGVAILERYHQRGFVSDEVYDHWQSQIPTPEITPTKAVFNPTHPETGLDLETIYSHCRSAVFRALSTPALTLEDKEDIYIAALFRIRQQKFPPTLEDAKRLLVRIAINLAIDKIRRNQIIKFDSLESATSNTLKPVRNMNGHQEKGPEEELLQAERDKLLKQALKYLPPSYQVVLEQFYMEELSISEIANNLIVSNGTIRTRLTRARQALKKILATEGFDPRTD